MVKTCQHRTKLWIFVFCVFSFAMLLALATPQGVQAGILFFADFEPNSRKAFPNRSVNEPGNWIPANKATAWTIADFPNGTKGLKQTAEGCGTSGNTPLPDPRGTLKNWSDGVIELEFAQGDDDSFAIIFRQSAPDKGYAMLLGTKETPAVILADLAKGCSRDGQCWSDNCENANYIKRVNHGLTFDINAGKTGKGAFYKARLEAFGDKIKLYYGEPGKEKLLIDVKDSTYRKGSIGIFHESNSNSMIDNVTVTGGLAVDPEGKLTTSWGWIKREF